MTKRLKDLAVVVPVFNGQQTLEELFERTQATCAKLDKDFSMVFVDDGSSDESWATIEELKAKHNGQIVGIKLAKNFGQHNATYCGLSAIAAQFYVTIDDDLQIPPEDIEKIWEKMMNCDADVVYGTYPKKHHSVMRNIGSEIIKKIGKVGASGPGERGTSFRILTADLVEKITAYNQSFLFIDEIIGWHTGQVAFEPVTHFPRKDGGTSSYSYLKLFKLAFELIVNYTALPLRLMTFLGLFSSIICTVLGVVYIFRKLAFGQMPGFTAIIVAIFFATGLILFCLGIIGEYIRKLYIAQNSKPTYSIKKIL